MAGDGSYPGPGAPAHCGSDAAAGRAEPAVCTLADRIGRAAAARFGGAVSLRRQGTARRRGRTGRGGGTRGADPDAGWRGLSHAAAGDLRSAAGALGAWGRVAAKAAGAGDCGYAAPV